MLSVVLEKGLWSDCICHTSKVLVYFSFDKASLYLSIHLKKNTIFVKTLQFFMFQVEVVNLSKYLQVHCKQNNDQLL